MPLRTIPLAGACLCCIVPKLDGYLGVLADLVGVEGMWLDLDWEEVLLGAHWVVQCFWLAHFDCLCIHFDNGFHRI